VVDELEGFTGVPEPGFYLRFGGVEPGEHFGGRGSAPGECAGRPDLVPCFLGRFSGDPARTLRYSERADAGLISLSLRHFREGLLIEVYDTDNDPPIRSHADADAENGRGLMLVDALSKEWSYFFPPGGGKVVYCFLEIS
jgi:hypothetical protein